jgi:hypothetical protein
MPELALGTWILTAFGGAYMWSYTTGVGRPESTARGSHLPPLVLFVHPLLALTGMAVWIAYLYHGGETLPWVALADLVVVALLGDLMAVRTLRARRTPERVPAGAPPDVQADHRLVEDQIPGPAIVVHGTAAVLTILLVLLVALGVGVGPGTDASYNLGAPAVAAH